MRYQQYLKERYKTLFGYIGGIWFIIGLAILAPLIMLLPYPDEVSLAPSFIITGGSLAAFGLFIRTKTPLDDAPSPTVQEGMVAIVIAWVTAIIIGTIPLMIVGNLTFSQAVFETTSGWTTTGLSVVDVENSSRILLFYRAMTQLIGGAGFAIIVLSSITGPTGSGLSTAEGRDDQLAPHVRQSASIVIWMYSLTIIIGAFVLDIVGMEWFDAINHAIAAVATGGFSTRAESIGYWDSAIIEMVIVVLMILGSINYLTLYIGIKGNIRALLKDGEVRLMAFLLSLGFILLFFGVTLTSYATDGTFKPVRIAIFEFVSALTTTGFSTVPYVPWHWSGLGWLVLIMAMLIGGGSGSTAGGIKIFRIYVLYKALVWEVRKAFMPNQMVNEARIWKGDHSDPLSNEQIRRIALYVFLYFVIHFGLMLIIAAHGFSIGEAMFEAASVVSGVGTSVGVTQPDAPPTLLWSMSIGMLLGRLEFFAIVIGSIKLIRDSLIIARPQHEDMAV